MNADQKFDRRYKRILEIVKAQPGISKTDLTLATRSISENDRNAIINQLIAAGKIREESTRGVGRPKTAYQPAAAAMASTQTQPAARGATGDVYAVEITHSEIVALNEWRRRQNEINARNGREQSPLLPVPL
jgi:hypothetical protein